MPIIETVLYLKFEHANIFLIIKINLKKYLKVTFKTMGFYSFFLCGLKKRFSLFVPSQKSIILIK